MLSSQQHGSAGSVVAALLVGVEHGVEHGTGLNSILRLGDFGARKRCSCRARRTARHPTAPSTVWPHLSEACFASLTAEQSASRLASRSKSSFRRAGVGGSSGGAGQFVGDIAGSFARRQRLVLSSGGGGGRRGSCPLVAPTCALDGGAARRSGLGDGLARGGGEGGASKARTLKVSSA